MPKISKKLLIGLGLKKYAKDEQDPEKVALAFDLAHKAFESGEAEAVERRPADPAAKLQFWMNVEEAVKRMYALTLTLAHELGVPTQEPEPEEELDAFADDLDKAMPRQVTDGRPLDDGNYGKSLKKRFHRKMHVVH